MWGTQVKEYQKRRHGRRQLKKDSKNPTPQTRGDNRLKEQLYSLMRSQTTAWARKLSNRKK